jgi:hypothetical protein
MSTPVDEGIRSTWAGRCRSPRIRLSARARRDTGAGRENNLPIVTQCFVPVYSGMGLIRMGQVAEGTALLERGISVWEQSGGRVASPGFKSVL